MEQGKQTGTNRWDRRRLLLHGLPLIGATACRTTPSGSAAGPTRLRRSIDVPAAGRGSAGNSGRARALAEFQRTFVASGASFRYPPHPAHGRAWSPSLQNAYDASKRDPRVGYAVQNLATGSYLSEWNADELKMGGSMPKPALSAIVLDKFQGELSRENFLHIVQVCDKSINASWRALNRLYTIGDERTFLRKYGLPPARILGNAQSPRFYCEFFRRCVNYQLDYGNELLLEAMRRAQYGRGRWYLPAEITYIGGKTGTFNEWKHEGLWFRYRGTPHAIVIYTKGYFGRGENYWKMGALFGGLFREHLA